VLASLIWVVSETALCVQVSETLVIEPTVSAHIRLGNLMTPAVGYHWRYAISQLGVRARSENLFKPPAEASRKLEATDVLSPHPPFAPFTDPVSIIRHAFRVFSLFVKLLLAIATGWYTHSLQRSCQSMTV